MLGLPDKFQGDARGSGSGEDLVVLADQFLGDRDGLVGVAAAVVVCDVQGGVPNLVRDLGCVVKPGLQTFVVGVTVRGQRSCFGLDDADVHGRGACAGAGARCRFR